MKRLIAGVLLCLVFSGCATFTGTAYKGLAALRAAYLIEEPIRVSACKNKIPRPAACAPALKAAKVAYTALVDGSEALAVWVETKDESAKARVIRILPVILSAAVDLTNAAESLK